MVFIADSLTNFWKQELNLRSKTSSVKKVFLENLQVSQEDTCVKVSF